MNEPSALTSVSLSRSHVQLLEQFSNEEFWQLAIERAHTNVTTHCQTEEYLVCDLGVRRCILALFTLAEIVSPPHQFTTLPAVPIWMLGITAWHGEIIAVIDLHKYLWSSEDTTNDRSHPNLPWRDSLLLVVQSADLALGFVVGKESTAMRFDTEQMVPFELAPDSCSGLRPGVVSGIVNDMPVLDISVILPDIVQHIKEH